MFNKSFNLTQFVKDIPSLAVRKQAWLGLVGSVNASLFGAADAIVQKLQAAGYTEFKELDRREFAALCSGPETGAGKDVIHANQKMYRLHVEWRSELLYTTNVASGRKTDGDLGSIASTITMMTGPQKEREISKEAVPMLASLGITVTPEQIQAAKRERLNADNHFANLRKQRAGAVEYVIDNLFATCIDDEDDENYSQLDGDVKEYLCNKFSGTLSRSLQTCINNTLFGRSGDNVLGVGDHIIINRLIPDLMTQITAISKPKAKRKAKVAKPVVQRAPKPAQSSKVIETLDNGIKVTREVTTN